MAASLPHPGRPLTTNSHALGPISVVRLRISVVICAYTDRRWDDIVAAVASIRGQTRPPSRTILVVDHNLPLLERTQVAFPDLQVVPNTGRRGLSGARNTGVSQAIGDVVAFLDDDARAEPDWLERRAATPVWPSQRPRWLPPEFDWVVGCSFVGMPNASTPVRNLIGANMSFRREVFGTIGGFTDGLGRVGS